MIRASTGRDWPRRTGAGISAVRPALLTALLVRRVRACKENTHRCNRTTGPHRPGAAQTDDEQLQRPRLVSSGPASPSLTLFSFFPPLSPCPPRLHLYRSLQPPFSARLVRILKTAHFVISRLRWDFAWGTSHSQPDRQTRDYSNHSSAIKVVWSLSPCSGRTLLLYPVLLPRSTLLVAAHATSLTSRSSPVEILVKERCPDSASKARLRSTSSSSIPLGLVPPFFPAFLTPDFGSHDI